MKTLIGSLVLMVALGYSARAAVTVNAGEDSTFTAGIANILGGTSTCAAPSSPCTYLWTQTAGTTTAITSATSLAAASINFTPASDNEQLTFRLTITGADAATANDSVNIGVVKVDSLNRLIITNSSVAFLIGPQLYSGAPNNPFPFFDSTEKTRSLFHSARYPTTPARALTGTVSATNGSVAIVGVGTKFLSEINTTDSTLSDYYKRLRITDSGGTLREVDVSSVADNTHLTTTGNWGFTTVSGKAADTYYTNVADGYNTVNTVINDVYYDLPSCLYIAYYRTGLTIYLTEARRLADSYWMVAIIPDVGLPPGPNRGKDTNYGWANPRNFNGMGFMLRALDGKPEYWDYIYRYVRTQYNNWIIGFRANAKIYDPREQGYMSLYGTLLAKVLPDTYTLYGNGTDEASTGTATDGAAKRTAFLSDVETDITNFWYVRQGSDGRVISDLFDADNLGHAGIDVMQPILAVLAAEHATLIPTISINTTARASARDFITRLASHLYADSYRNTTISDFTSAKWRAMWYYCDGGLAGNLTLYNNGGNPDGAGMPATIGGDIEHLSQARGNQATTHFVFGYAYLLSGNSIYKTYGDEVFGASFGDAIDSYHGLANTGLQAKEYTQSYRWSGRYLAARVSGVIPPSPTPTPTPSPTPEPTPTPAPTPTPTPTPSGTPCKPNQLISSGCTCQVPPRKVTGPVNARRCK